MKGANAAFVVGGLEPPIGRVAGVGPADGDGAVAFHGARRDVGRGIGLLGAGAVVCEEHDECVVPLAQLLDLGKEAPEVLVIRSIMAAYTAILRSSASFCASVKSSHALEARPAVGYHDGDLFIRLHVAGNLVPADLVFAAVLGDVLGPSVQTMCGAVSVGRGDTACPRPCIRRGGRWHSW